MFWGIGGASPGNCDLEGGPLSLLPPCHVRRMAPPSSPLNIPQIPVYHLYYRTTSTSGQSYEAGRGKTETNEMGCLTAGPHRGASPARRSSTAPIQVRHSIPLLDPFVLLILMYVLVQFGGLWRRSAWRTRVVSRAGGCHPILGRFEDLQELSCNTFLPCCWVYHVFAWMHFTCCLNCRLSLPTNPGFHDITHHFGPPKRACTAWVAAWRLGRRADGRASPTICSSKMMEWIGKEAG